MATVTWDGTGGNDSQTWHRDGKLELARDINQSVDISGNFEIYAYEFGTGADSESTLEDFYIDGSLIENYHRQDGTGVFSDSSFTTTVSSSNLDIDYSFRAELDVSDGTGYVRADWRINDNSSTKNFIAEGTMYADPDGDPVDVVVKDSHTAYDFLYDYFTSGTWTSNTRTTEHTQAWQSIDVTCSLNGNSGSITVYDKEGGSVNHSLADGTNTYSLSGLNYSNKLQVEVNLSGTTSSSPSVTDIAATGARHNRVKTYDGGSWNEAVLKVRDSDNTWNDDVPHFYENGEWKQ